MVSEAVKVIFTEVSQALARSSSQNGLSLGKAVRTALKDLLLAENPDAGEAAQARCRACRKAFAAEVRLAFSKEASVERWLLGKDVPVRVEVRGTAARQVNQAAFTVGSQPDCDVEVFGDPTVHPLQCVVVNLPGRILVGDFWSGGGTRMTWKMTRDETGVALDANPAVFAIGHDERVILQLGEKSSIALGPSARKLRKLRKLRKRSLEEYDPAELQENAPVQKLQKCRAPSLASTSCGSLFEAVSCKSASCSSQSPSLSPAMCPMPPPLQLPDILETLQNSDAGDLSCSKMQI